MMEGSTVYEALGDWPGWASLAVFAVVWVWKRKKK
jgi:hypothetical protein